VALGKEYAVDPAWSPTGRFLVYSGRDVGTSVPVKAINADGSAHALPSLVLSRGARRMDFLDENRLVVLKGNLSHKELWVVDLRSGDERQLTALGAGELIGDFDVSADGGEIVFDRTREASDIMLIELAGS
jgi:Tol biopolymer transport system component